MGPALRHFVEEALGRRADDFEDWFPACFHWRGLCADAPAMAARSQGVDAAEIPLESAVDLRTRAERLFTFSHLASLAVLAAAVGEDADPGDTLALLTSEPEEGEEESFAQLVAEVLEPLEHWIAGDEVELDARGERSAALLDLCWPEIEPFLSEDDLLGQIPEVLPLQPDVLAGVLGSITLLASMLATFRWQALGQGGA